MLKRKENADPRRRATGNRDCVELATRADGPGDEEARQAQTPAEWPNGQKAVPAIPPALLMEETGEKAEVPTAAPTAAPTEDPISKTDPSANSVDAFLAALRQVGRDSRALAGVKICVTGPTVEDVTENTGLAVEDVRRQTARRREPRDGEAGQAVRLADPRSRQRRGGRHRGIVAAPEPGHAAPPPHTVTNVSRSGRSSGSRADKIKKLLQGIGQLFAAKTLPALSDSLLADAARKVGPVYTKILNEIARREGKRNVVFTSLKRHNRTVTQKQEDRLAAIVNPPAKDNRAIDAAKLVIDFFRDNGREVFTMDQALEVIETLGLGFVVGAKYDRNTGKKIYSRQKARIVLGDQFGRNCLNLPVVADSNRNRHYHVGKKKAVKVTA
ncbi:MAG: hypothetical protein QGG42_15705 [Phycisphaerae bacterium]|jgi:hypothetical protein|nr:hypothetical protein [Phycisphaerae bacterium]